MDLWSAVWKNGGHEGLDVWRCGGVEVWCGLVEVWYGGVEVWYGGVEVWRCGVED